MFIVKPTPQVYFICLIDRRALEIDRCLMQYMLKFIYPKCDKLRNSYTRMTIVWIFRAFRLREATPGGILRYRLRDDSRENVNLVALFNTVSCV